VKRAIISGVEAVEELDFDLRIVRLDWPQQHLATRLGIGRNGR
jgi:hypothetical protein